MRFIVPVGDFMQTELWLAGLPQEATPGRDVDANQPPAPSGDGEQLGPDQLMLLTEESLYDCT